MTERPGATLFRVAASPNDTSDAVARIQHGLLRKAGPGRRADVARSLSSTVIDLSRRALLDRMPTATPREVLLRWVALEYGGDLAERVATYLAAVAQRRLREGLEGGTNGRDGQ